MAYETITFGVGQTLTASKMQVLDNNIDIVRANHLGDNSSPVTGMIYINSSDTTWQVMMYDASTYVGLYAIDTVANSSSLLGVTEASDLTAAKMIDLDNDRIANSQIGASQIGSLSIANIGSGQIGDDEIASGGVSTLTGSNAIIKGKLSLSNGSTSGTISVGATVEVTMANRSFYPDWQSDYAAASGLLMVAEYGTADRTTPTFGFYRDGASSTDYSVEWTYIDA